MNVCSGHGLDKNVDASWDKLIQALKSPSVELNHLASEITEMLMKRKTFINFLFFVVQFSIYILCTNIATFAALKYNLVTRRVPAWFNKIVSGKVCVYICLYVCMFVFLHPHEQNFISQKQPVHKK